jgi:cell division protein FtsB
MGRRIAILFAIVLSAAAGYVVGYLRSGKQAIQARHVEPRIEATSAELSSLHDQKQDLEQRVGELTKEQERLAQENEILRKQLATGQLLGRQSGELPALPPK